MSKILTLDIETTPTLGYVWDIHDARMGLNQIVNPGGIACVCAKWFGDKKVYSFSDWEHGQWDMAQGIHELMDQADAIITYNGDRFDLPKLTGLFAKIGLALPAPAASIDVWKIGRKLGYPSSKLEFLANHLLKDGKIRTGGFDLWADMMNGDEKARKKMLKYCEQDVRLLERLYKYLLPYITNHPFLSHHIGGACPNCGGHDVQRRGYRMTRCFRIQRLQCQDCGSWHSGARQKVA